MAWGIITDDEAFPTLRRSVRGGTTAKAGHASQDQFSFKCMVNSEFMISDQHDRPGVSFTKRGNDAYGRSATSKSGLFVEGLGCDLSMATDTTEVVYQVFRWITSEQKNDNVLATALNPGSRKLGLKLRRESRGFVSIEVSESGQRDFEIRLSKKLKGY